MKQSNKVNILLVDDDHLVIDDLLCSFDWEKEGFHIVGTANNGKKALSLFRTLRPQIVITDVIMPIMNGIELISAIRALDEKTEFLILSSYDEFEYAKSAMKLGVMDYLLKMELSPAILLDKLREISSKLKIEQETLSLHQQLLLQEYIQHHDISTSIFDLLLQNRYYFYCISASNPYRYQQFNRLPAKPVAQTALDYIAQTLELNNRDIIFSAEHYIIVGFLVTKSSHTASAYLTSILDTLPQLSKSAKIFYLRNACTIKQFRNIFDNSLEKNNFDLLFSSDICICMERPLKNVHDSTVTNIPVSVTASTVNNLFSKESSKNDLTIFVDQLLQYEHKDPCISLFHYACAFMETAKYEQDMFHDAVSFRSFILLTYENAIKNRNTEELNFSAHVTHAIQFIEKTFSDSNLSNEVIADNLGISCGRLSVLFKKETGKTLVEYITDYRIQQASWLLLNSNKKIYEIASAVGYNSSQYFSQIFLHRTGKKPLDYRQSSITNITIGE